MVLEGDGQRSEFLFPSIRVLVRGGGDLGSGVIYRLHHAGFPVLVTELPRPLLVRRGASYGSAVVEGGITVDGLRAVKIESLGEVQDVQAAGEIPVIADEKGDVLNAYLPDVVVDARMRKLLPEKLTAHTLLLIGLGPGFTAPDNCDAVIETMRGQWLGRVIRQGSALPDTGVPGEIGGESTSRVLRAPSNGAIRSLKAIGKRVEKGEAVAQVSGDLILSPLSGVLRGLVHDGTPVMKGMKVGDIDPRADSAACFAISDKALAIGGGILEAIFSHPIIRESISNRR